MANENLSEMPIDINDPQFLITERFNGRPAILSTQVADRFLKKHQHILRDIGNLRGMLPKSFDASNFGRVALKDKKGESRPAYLLTRDAFTLLVMGMTGKTAVGRVPRRLYKRTTLPAYLDPEWQANRFAGGFLMPDPIMGKCVREGWSDAKIARYFNVSLQAAQIRRAKMAK